MNIVTRLIQVIHWMSFIMLLILIGIILLAIAVEDVNNLSIQRDEEIFVYIACSAILMPFIRFIIFGRFGWFPWTPFRKE